MNKLFLPLAIFALMTINAPSHADDDQPSLQAQVSELTSEVQDLQQKVADLDDRLSESQN